MLCQVLGIFLLLVKLELHDVAFVSSDLLVVANVNLFGTLRDQSHVVTDHEHSTLEVVDATSQRVDRFHVEGIRRFVKHQEVRPFVGNNRKDDARFLARRELVHYLGLLPTRATVPSEQGSDLFDRLLRHDLLLEEIERRHGQIEFLFEMLREARDTQVGVSFDGSLGREQITGHEFDQCCFSCHRQTKSESDT